MTFAIVILALVSTTALFLWFVERYRVRRRRAQHERAAAYHQKQKELWERAAGRDGR